MLDIDPKTHTLLLYYLNELRYDEAHQFRKELQDTYAALIVEVAHYEILERTIRIKVENNSLPQGREVNTNC